MVELAREVTLPNEGVGIAADVKCMESGGFRLRKSWRENRITHRGRKKEI